METKPIHAKPQLYAYYFYALKDIAKEFGYNLVVHGSMNRDLDLVAIPWVDDPKPELEMIQALNKHMTGHITVEGHEKTIYLISNQPGGRRSYVIQLNRGGYRRNKEGDIADPIEFVEDPQYYIDISVIAQAPDLLAKVSELQNEIKELKYWKESEMKLWGPIIDYAQTHQSELGLKLGESISEKILRFLKDRTEIRKALESITLSMKAHPDCTPGSEFADMVSIAEKALKSK